MNPRSAARLAAWASALLISALFLAVAIPAHAQVLGPGRGGTGTNTVPSFGEVLVGQANGTYAPIATSSLGLYVPFAWTPQPWGNSTSTTLGFSNGFLSTASSSFSGSTYFPAGIWNSSGQLGVGTTAPTAPLTIEPISGGIAQLLYRNFANNIAQQFTNTMGSAYAGLNLNGDYGIRTGNADLGAADFVLTQGNQVGIGTTSPYAGAKLAVSGMAVFDRNASIAGSNIANAAVLVTNPGASTVLGFDTNEIYSTGGLTLGTIGGNRTLTFAPNAVTAMTILDGGYIGVGTTTPGLVRFYVSESNPGVSSPPANARTAVFEKNGDNGISLFSPDGNLNTINFGTPSDSVGATIEWDYTDNQLTLGPRSPSASTIITYGNGGTGISINGSGNVGIATSSPDIAGTALDNLVIGNGNGNQGVVFDSGATGLSAFGFADQGSIVGRVIYDNGADTMTFAGNGLSADITIAADSRVGIGTSTPDGMLTVYSGASGAVAPASAVDDLVIENNSGAGITVKTGPANTGNIYFADSGASGAGRIIYDHANDSFAFHTATAEALRINSSQQVGIGTTSPAYRLHVGASGAFNALTVDGTTGHVGVNSPPNASYTMYVQNDVNAEGLFYYSTSNVLTSERDSFVVQSADSAGSGQDESSVVKVLQSGNVSADADGFSLLELTMTGTVSATKDKQFYVLGRVNDEGVVRWGVDYVEANFWTEGSLYGGATGTNCGGTGSACFTSPTIAFQDSAVSYLNTGFNFGIGTTTPSVTLDVNGAIRTRPAATSTCDALRAGSMYFDSDDSHFYGCNGSGWVRLDN